MLGSCGILRDDGPVFDFNRPMTLVTAADGTIAATLRAGRRYELRFA